MMGHVLDLDPAGGILAVHAMLRTQIAMPGRNMGDATEPDLFDRFALVAQRLGVYTAADYAAILDHLVRAWKVAERRVSDRAARAQDEICRASERYARLADRVAARLAKQPPVPFSWIQGRLA
jgi:acyl-[acyl-carrier-protein] desaturase